MAEYRLSQVARKLNVGKNTILDFLKEKGHEVDSNPNSKIPQEQYDMLAREFADSAHDKEEASELTIGGKTDNLVINAEKVSAEEKKEDERILIKDNVTAESEPEKISARTKLDGPKVVGKIDLDKKKKEEAELEEPKEEVKEEMKEEAVEVPEPAKEVKEETPEVKEELPQKEDSKPEAKESEEEEKKPEKEVIKAKADSLRGLKVLDKIELPKDKPKPVASSDSNQDRKKRPRKRIQSAGGPPQRGGGGGGNRNDRGRSTSGRKTEELSDKEIQDKIKATLAKLSGGSGKGGSQRSKYRKDKRSAKAEAEEERQLQAEEESKTDRKSVV